jgi:hypothetical protein
VIQAWPRLMGGRGLAESSAPIQSRLFSYENIVAHDVLIAYEGTQRKALGEALCFVLESKRIRCWIAPRDVPAGVSVMEAQIAAIRCCRVVVPIPGGETGGPLGRDLVELVIQERLTLLPIPIECGSGASSAVGPTVVTHWLDAFTPEMERDLARFALALEAVLSITQEPSVRNALEDPVVSETHRARDSATPPATVANGSNETDPFVPQVGTARCECVIYLVDESREMLKGIAGSTRARVEFIADCVNRDLAALAAPSQSDGSGEAGSLDIAVIGYTTSTDGTPRIRSALADGLGPSPFVSSAILRAEPMRVRERIRLNKADQGRLVDTKSSSPLWYSPLAAEEMGGAPMCAALVYCHSLTSDWCRRHPLSPRPIIISFSAGVSTDGSPDRHDEVACALGGKHATAFLFHIHLSGSPRPPSRFPVNESDLADEESRLLFRLSSPISPEMRVKAQAQGFTVPEHARGMAINHSSQLFLNFVSRAREGSLVALSGGMHQ